MVIDITARLEEKKKQEELEGFKKWFSETFGDQPIEVIKQIREAIANKDQEAYKQITEPIILRKLMIEYNK